MSSNNPVFTFTTAVASKQRKRARLGRSRRTFWLLTPFSGASALASLLLSLCTTDWLRTEEKMPNRNRTVLFGPDKSPEYLPKLSRSGLFTICATKPGRLEYSCTRIDYFPEEDYAPDQNDSTLAIPHAVIHSAWLFFVSGGLMLAAGALTMLGHLFKEKKLLTFVAGVAFIISGLLLFVGQVVYISILKGEVGSKLVPMSFLSPPRFTYEYGWSFLALVSSFLWCEAAGVSAISLFLFHHQYRYVCAQPLSTELMQRDREDGRIENRASNGGAGAAIIGWSEDGDRRAPQQWVPPYRHECVHCGFSYAPSAPLNPISGAGAGGGGGEGSSNPGSPTATTLLTASRGLLDTPFVMVHPRREQLLGGPHLPQ